MHRCFALLRRRMLAAYPSPCWMTTDGFPLLSVLKKPALTAILVSKFDEGFPSMPEHRCC